MAIAAGESKFAGVAQLERLIRVVPDFPKPGIVFKDITPLLRDPAGLSLAVEYLTQPFRSQRVVLWTSMFTISSFIISFAQDEMNKRRKPIPSKVDNFVMF